MSEMPAQDCADIILGPSKGKYLSKNDYARGLRFLRRHPSHLMGREIPVRLTRT